MGLRNVVHRRNHKERAQPTHRNKFGLLEKHKDYVQRAKDHNVKKQRIQKLAQKAALRNPDEFNFGMIRGASNDLLKGGLHMVRRKGGDSEPMENDLVAILKSQDLSYVRSVIRAEEKKMNELRQTILPQLSFMSQDWIQSKEGREEILIRQGLLLPGSIAAASSIPSSEEQPIAFACKKTVWVEDEIEARSFKATKRNSKLGVSSATNLGKYSLDMDDDDNDNDNDEEAEASNKSAEKRLGFLISQLDARQNRLDTLNEARSKLEVVRALMTTKGTNVRKSQAKSDAIKSAIVNGKVTANGLTAQAEDDEDDEEDSLGKKKAKKTTWKWGRERKK